jgi:hypothetical protein
MLHQVSSFNLENKTKHYYYYGREKAQYIYIGQQLHGCVLTTRACDIILFIIPCIAVVQTNDEGNLIWMVHNREA